MKYSGQSIGAVIRSVDGQALAVLRAWSPTLLDYVTLTVDASGNLNTAGGASTGGSGSGSTSVSIPDGYDVTQGSGSDAAVTTNSSGTVSAKLRGLTSIFGNVWDSAGGRLKVDGSGVTQPVSGPLTDTQLRASAVPVSGAFFPATQPVSGTVSVATSTAQIGSVSLLAGSSANMLGLVANALSTAQIGSVSLLAGSSANTVGAVALVAGSSANMLGTVALPASTAMIGLTQERAASTATRSVAITSVDVQLLAANTARVGAVIYNASSASVLMVGFSTGVVSTSSFTTKIGSCSALAIGFAGGLPNYTGMIRARLESTVLAASAFITEMVAT